MNIQTLEGRSYAITAVSVPLSVRVVVGGKVVVLATIEEPGQLSVLVAPSHEFILDQDDALVTPVGVKGGAAGLANGRGSDYVLPVATGSRLGGVKVGAGVDVADDGTISVERAEVPGNLVYTDKPNVVTGLTVFTEPVSVADAVGSDDAVNLKMMRLWQAAECDSTPLMLVPGGGQVATADQVITCGHNSLLSYDATKAAVFATHYYDPNHDQNPYALVLATPTNRNETGLTISHMGMAMSARGGIVTNPAPKLGSTVISSTAHGVSADLFPADSGSGNVIRVQAMGIYSGKEVVEGLCILPEKASRVILISTAWVNHGLENVYIKSVFAVTDLKQVIHLLNILPVNSATYGYQSIISSSPTLKLCLGRAPVNTASNQAFGLTTLTKAYYGAVPFAFTSDQYSLKNLYMFVRSERNESGNLVPASRWDIDADEHLLVSVWNQSGTVSVSAKYPSSSWLSAETDGVNVTVKAEANETGVARQGVVNLEASVNGVTYSILINQSV